MDWSRLGAYQCPKCNAYLTYKKIGDVWVCKSSCGFAIGGKKRDDIAGKYPFRKSALSKEIAKEVLSN